jgi:hypothetical protein
MTADAKIIHIRCSGTGLCGALGGDAAASHTASVLHHIASHVESLIPLPQSARSRAAMRDGVGERIAHGPTARGNTYHREGLPCRTANPDKLT